MRANVLPNKETKLLHIYINIIACISDNIFCHIVMHPNKYYLFGNFRHKLAQGQSELPLHSLDTASYFGEWMPSTKQKAMF